MENNESSNLASSNRNTLNTDDDDYLEQESKDFFHFINNFKTEEIKRFLAEETIHEIWKYISKEDNKETVIHIALKADEKPITNIILKYCQTHLSEIEFKKFINKKNSKGVTAIHYASFQGNIDIIKYLINYGADINCLTSRNLNVIHYAAQGNKPNSLMYFYLFHRGIVDLTSIDIGGSTALHWASYSSSIEIAMYLIYYGADINAKDKNWNTPLHLAVIKNSYKMVQKLLQKGVDTTIKNKEKKTAKDIALKNKFDDIYKLLEESENCQLCNIKAPTQKKAKSTKNIIIVFSFQIFAAFILFCFIFPYTSLNISNKILYGFFFWGYILFTITFFFFYIKLIFSTPGIPKKFLTINNIKRIMSQKEVKINLFKYCPKCLVKRAKDIRHCIICDQCFEGFDHHCYWVNNCIGKNNYMYFMSFLLLSFLDVIYILIICIHSFFVGSLKSGINLKDIREHCKDKINKSFTDFQKFPECLILSKNFGLKICLNIALFLSNLFFLIPIFLLVIIHFQNIYERRKKENSRKETSSSVQKEDFLLREILCSEDESYSITDLS